MVIISDRELQRFAEHLAEEILAEQAHLRKEALAVDSVPVFLSRGFEEKNYHLSSRASILESWESDPDNELSDHEFIDQLRRDDLPAGSFFVLTCPARHPVYHWLLHEGDPSDENGVALDLADQ
jgi:hypothetical protein